MDKNLFLIDPAETVKTHNVKAVFLFGSQTTGQTHQESDTDIGVIVENKRTFDFTNLLANVSKIITEPMKLHLVIADERYSSPLLLFEITKGILIYEAREGQGALLKAKAMQTLLRRRAQTKYYI